MVNLQSGRDIMGESEQCGNTALTHISDLTGGHQLPDKDSTRLSPSQYRKQWRQTPWGKKTEKARSLASSYQRGGKLTKQPCEVCGDPNTEKHHENYDYALDVRWLCHDHHRMVTAGEIKLEPRKPCLLPLPDRSESIMLGRMAKRIGNNILGSCRVWPHNIWVLAGLFAVFLLLSACAFAKRVKTDAPVFSHERALTTNHLFSKGESWLPRVYVPARDANQTPLPLSVARSLKESKFRPWTTTAQSEFFSKTEPISGLILSRSFGSLPIIPTGKLTTTNASNAGHLSVPNNNFSNIKPEPAERRVLSSAATGLIFLSCKGVPIVFRIAKSLPPFVNFLDIPKGRSAISKHIGVFNNSPNYHPMIEAISRWHGRSFWGNVVLLGFDSLYAAVYVWDVDEVGVSRDRVMKDIGLHSNLFHPSRATPLVNASDPNEHSRRAIIVEGSLIAPCPVNAHNYSRSLHLSESLSGKLGNISIFLCCNRKSREMAYLESDLSEHVFGLLSGGLHFANSFFSVLLHLRKLPAHYPSLSKHRDEHSEVNASDKQGRYCSYLSKRSRVGLWGNLDDVSPTIRGCLILIGMGLGSGLIVWGVYGDEGRRFAFGITCGLFLFVFGGNVLIDWVLRISG